MTADERKRTLLSLVPLAVLVGLLSLDIAIFGSDSILGASQVSLLVASGVCVALAAWRYKMSWKTFEGAIAKYIGEVTSAILILLLIHMVRLRRAFENRPPFGGC